MSPRLGAITTGIALSLTIILGVSVSNADTTIDSIGVGAWSGSATVSESFTAEEAATETCTLTDGSVGLTFVDKDGTPSGSLTNTATLNGCQTTVDGTITANINETTPPAGEES